MQQAPLPLGSLAPVVSAPDPLAASFVAIPLLPPTPTTPCGSKRGREEEGEAAAAVGVDAQVVLEWVEQQQQQQQQQQQGGGSAEAAAAAGQEAGGGFGANRVVRRSAAGPLTPAEVQAIQAVCAMTDGPRLAWAVQGILHHVRQRHGSGGGGEEGEAERQGGGGSGGGTTVGGGAPEEQ